MPDFSGEFRGARGHDHDQGQGDDHDSKENKEDVEKANSEEKETSSVWKFKQRPHSALEEFVGFQVPEGEVEEKGVRYRFELWEREE